MSDNEKLQELVEHWKQKAGGGPIWPDDLIKANIQLGTLNVELMMQRTDLIASIKEAINTKPSGFGDWKRGAKRMLRKLKDPATCDQIAREGLT